MGGGSKDCIVSLVERKSGLLLIGKLADRTTASLNRRVIRLIRRDEGAFATVTADNGTEFHDYKGIEARTQSLFYFARPYHSWERGSNENANGLIRQYLPATPSHESSTCARASAWASGRRWSASMNLSQCCASKLMSGAAYFHHAMPTATNQPSRRAMLVSAQPLSCSLQSVDCPSRYRA